MARRTDSFPGQALRQPITTGVNGTFSELALISTCFWQKAASIDDPVPEICA
jgi:hypothetical protein